jgi:rubrerythrin
MIEDQVEEHIKSHLAEVNEELEKIRFRNFYKCYKCGNEWVDEDSCIPDDDCPQCGARHVSCHLTEDI